MTQPQMPGNLRRRRAPAPAQKCEHSPFPRPSKRDLRKDQFQTKWPASMTL